MKTRLLLICMLTAFLAVGYSCDSDPVAEPDYQEEDNDNNGGDTEDNQDNEEDPSVPTDPGDQDDGDLDNNSQNVDYENAITIHFTDGDIKIDNPFSESGVTIVDNYGHLVVMSDVTDIELNYILSGTISDGSVKFYGEKKFGLILNGVGITNPTGAAINNQCEKKITVTIVDGTNNRLIDGPEYVYTDDEDMKATLFSEGNMVINGNGNLEIRGKNKHGLCVDGSLDIQSGTINIKESASDGIHTNAGINISGGDLTIRSSSDGIECESKKEPILFTGGNVNIFTTGEKGHGIKAKYNVEIDSPDPIHVTVYGNASKAIKPTGDFIMTRGNLALNTAGDAIWEDDEQDTSSGAGIKCDGNFVMDSGTITILSTGSGGKGINVDGTLTINDGTVTVTTTGDQYVYDRNNDTAAKAIKSTGDLTVNGGTITIRTSKTEAEGLESKATLTINDGWLDIVAYDDCINASDHIQFNGGTVYCSSSGNDGVDSNGTLTINGGLIVSEGTESPEDGFDCDRNRFSITGGIAIGVGGSTSTPTASASTQNSLIYTASSSPSVIRIEATDGGAEVLTYKLTRTYSRQFTLLFTSPQLAANTGYTLKTGGTVTGGNNFNGYYTGATYSGGTSAGTFTTGTAGAVSTLGSGNSGPGGGGRP